MTAPHEVIAWRSNRSPFTGSVAVWHHSDPKVALRRLLDGGREWIRVKLANGQEVVVRPLPEDRRWRPMQVGDGPAGQRIEMRRVKRLDGTYVWHWRPAR